MSFSLAGHRKYQSNISLAKERLTEREKGQDEDNGEHRMKEHSLTSLRHHHSTAVTMKKLSSLIPECLDVRKI